MPGGERAGRWKFSEALERVPSMRRRDPERGGRGSLRQTRVGRALFGAWPSLSVARPSQPSRWASGNAGASSRLAERVPGLLLGVCCAFGWASGFSTTALPRVAKERPERARKRRRRNRAMRDAWPRSARSLGFQEVGALKVRDRSAGRRSSDVPPQGGPKGGP